MEKSSKKNNSPEWKDMNSEEPTNHQHNELKKYDKGTWSLNFNILKNKMKQTKDTGYL